MDKFKQKGYFKITLDANPTSKTIDANGYWHFKNIPIARSGILSYAGSELPEAFNLDKNKIYKVYRAPEELFSKKTMESFINNPMTLYHLNNTDGEHLEYDNRIEGVFTNDYKKDDDLLAGDCIVYTDKLKNAINKGVKEISIGFTAVYEKADGEIDGEKYSFIQKDILGNHIAIVPRGRSGHKCRVCDEKIFIGDINMDKREIIREVEAILYEIKDGEKEINDELIKTIIGKLEKISYSPSETNEKDDDENDDECGNKEVENKDDEENEDDKEPEEKKNEENKEIENKDKGNKNSGHYKHKGRPGEIGGSVKDSFELILEKINKISEEQKKIADRINFLEENANSESIKITSKDALYDLTKNYTGVYDYKKYSFDDLSKVICDKLGLDTKDGSELDNIKSYLKAKQDDTPKGTGIILDDRKKVDNIEYNWEMAFEKITGKK